jgi:Mg-chelatase subunit ChlD
MYCWTIHSTALDLDLKETAPTIDLPQVLRPEAFELRLQVYRGVLHHMSLSQDDKHIVMGSGRSNKLIVIDLESRTSWLADAPETINGFYVGVAFNPYEGSPLHLLAAHTGKFIHLLQPTSDWKQFVLAGRFELPFAALWPDNYLGGPQLAVAWTGPNDLAVSYRQPRAGEATGHKFEFVGIHIDQNGQLSIVVYYDLDWDAASHPNGLAQCNGPKCNLPLPTATPPPPPSPTRTATNTPMPTPTNTPEPCVPRRLRADVVLVADVSSSMIGQPIIDLKTALTTVVDIMEAPSQVAIAWFARTAGLDPTGLTTDKVHLRGVISALQTGSGTSIDQGLEKARIELNSSHHIPTHSKVVILFSDGVHNGTGDVRAVARALKAEGANIFTVGLGDAIDRPLLEEIASKPSQFYHSPTSAQLADIYRQVAADIPCPTPAP